MAGNEIDQQSFNNSITAGFQQLSFDLKNLIKETNAGRIQLQNDAIQISNSAVNATTQINRKGNSFFNETFSNTYNRPALWSRDIATLMGQEYVDVNRQQARFESKQNWAKRGEQFGMEALSTASMFVPGIGLPLWAATEFIAKPLIKEDIERKYAWQSFAEKTGWRNVTAGKGASGAMGGWTQNEMKQIGKSMVHGYWDTGFDKNQFDDITKEAESKGYFKMFDKASVDTFKQKSKDLMEGVKSIMQTLHATASEGTTMMSDFNMKNIRNTGMAINKIGIASTFTGIGAPEIHQYAMSMAKYNSAAYGVSFEQSYMGAIGDLRKNYGRENPMEYEQKKQSVMDYTRSNLLGQYMGLLVNKNATGGFDINQKGLQELISGNGKMEANLRTSMRNLGNMGIDAQTAMQHGGNMLTMAGMDAETQKKLLASIYIRQKMMETGWGGRGRQAQTIELTSGLMEDFGMSYKQAGEMTVEFMNGQRTGGQMSGGAGNAGADYQYIGADNTPINSNEDGVKGFGRRAWGWLHGAPIFGDKDKYWGARQKEHAQDRLNKDVISQSAIDMWNNKSSYTDKYKNEKYSSLTKNAFNKDYEKLSAKLGAIGAINELSLKYGPEGIKYLKNSGLIDEQTFQSYAKDKDTTTAMNLAKEALYVDPKRNLPRNRMTLSLEDIQNASGTDALYSKAIHQRGKLSDKDVTSLAKELMYKKYGNKPGTKQPALKYGIAAIKEEFSDLYDARQGLSGGMLTAFDQTILEKSPSTNKNRADAFEAPAAENMTKIAEMLKTTAEILQNMQQKMSK